MSYPTAQIARVGIRRIVRHFELERRGVGAYEAAWRVEQGPNHTVGAPGRNGSEALHAGATQEPLEHGLGLVVLGVSHRDVRCAHLLRLCDERTVASVARLGLPGRARGHLHRQGVEGHPEGLRQPACRGHVTLGVRPQAMIDRRRVERQTQLRRECVKHVQEDLRVGPARTSNEDGRRTVHQVALHDGSFDTRTERRDGGLEARTGAREPIPTAQNVPESSVTRVELRCARPQRCRSSGV